MIHSKSLRKGKRGAQTMNAKQIQGTASHNGLLQVALPWFGRVLAVALAFALLLPALAQASGRNAWHFFVRDNLTGWGDAELVGGNTLYTPDLVLNAPGVGNQLQNKSLDEVFLKITFKSGVTPDISKLVKISYGTEFAFTPGNQNLYSRVAGQDLLVWYGLQDRADFGQTTVLTDSQWTFTIVGDHPVTSVDLFISYHSNTASEMPDLLPLNYNNL